MATSNPAHLTASTPRRQKKGGSLAQSAAFLLVLSTLDACASTSVQEINASDSSSREGIAPAQFDKSPDDAHSPKKLVGTTDETIFLSSIKTVVGAGVLDLMQLAPTDKDFSRSLRVRIQVQRGYTEFGEMSARSGKRLVNGAFYLSDLSELESKDPVRRQHRKSSFVMDYDDAGLVELERRYRTTTEGTTPEEIAFFVSTYIEDKNYSHGFDIASRVAQNRAGDCTEHAVLTVALCRSLGLPARLITGIVLVGTSGKDRPPHLRAAGHAWTEVYSEGRWLIVDAALSPGDKAESNRTGVVGLDPSDSIRIVYLPISKMEDESVSYSRAMADKVSVGSVVRINVDSVSAPLAL